MMQVGVRADQSGTRRFICPRQERSKVNVILDNYVEHYKRGVKRGIP